MSEQQLENFAETQLYQRFRRMVDGNNASATDVRIENHESFNTIINHSSIWTFGVEISEDQVKTGRSSPTGSIIVNREEYVTQRDIYAEQLKSDQDLQNSFIEKRLVLAKKNPNDEIKTAHKPIKTKLIIISCYEKCISCNGKGSLICEKCYGKGKLICKACNGSRGCYKEIYEGSKFAGRLLSRTFISCSSCGGSGTTICLSCLGFGSTNCTHCNGTGILTHFFEIQGYAYPQRKYYVNGSSESEKFLENYINDHSVQHFLKHVTSSTFKQYLKVDNHVCFDYSSETTIADLTFSIRDYENVYRLRSYGNPIELFERCNLYDDLLKNEIIYTKHFYNKRIKRKELKQDFKRFKKIPVLNQALEAIAKNKETKKDAKVGEYFSASCDYCISDQSAEYLGSFLSRVLNRISPTGSFIFMMLFFASVFLLFAIEQEHFAEAEYKGGVDGLLTKMGSYTLGALGAYIAFWGLNRLILYIRNRFVDRKFRQRVRDKYLVKYIVSFAVIMLLSTIYGVSAVNGKVPKIGERPYELKKEYFDHLIVDSCIDYYHTLEPIVDQNVWQPLKSGFYITLDYADRYIWQTSRVGFVATKHWVYDDLLPWIGNVNDQGQKWIDSDVVPASVHGYETSFPYFMEYVWDPALNAFSLVKKYSFSLLGIELPQPKIPETPKALNIEQKNSKNTTKAKKSSANKKSNKGRKSSTNR